MFGFKQIDARLFPLLFMVFASISLAQELAEEDLPLLVYGNEEEVSIATGSKQSIAKAPAVATLITAEQIETMGATELDQVLETVPGLHISISATVPNAPIYTIRGIQSNTNPHALVMINGIPITDVFQGNRDSVWGGMPVRNIAYIEIIRGPGSAIHGGNAMSGVVNIVTKTANEIDGLYTGAGIGSFNAREGWIQYGDSFNDFNLALSAQLYRTDGYDAIIESDAQTGFDQQFGTSASLAPGSMNNAQKRADLRMDISSGGWRFRSGYQGRYGYGQKIGASQALDPDGEGYARRFNADLNFEQFNHAGWDFGWQLSYLAIKRGYHLKLFPNGAFNGDYPDGVIGNPSGKERHIRGNGWFAYNAIHNHQFRFGLGTQRVKLFDAEDYVNFNPDLSPIGQVVRADENQIFMTNNHSRTIYHAYVQDQWSFAPDWEFTGGVRLDNYSDFGQTVNPRFALVWQTSYDISTKLLYGRAFRPPSFQELYNINNPVLIGNPDLKPETIHTYELAFDYHPAPTAQAALNLFYYEMNDIIRFTTDNNSNIQSAKNIGDQTGYGFELEGRRDINSAWSLLANFSWQHTEDKATNQDPGLSPHYLAYGKLSWKPHHRWTLSTQVNYVAERLREANDTRTAIDDYMTWNFAIVRSDRKNDWSARFTARNIFNQDAREPSQSPGLIANDIPTSGRSFWLESGYHF